MDSKWFILLSKIQRLLSKKFSKNVIHFTMMKSQFYQKIDDKFLNKLVQKTTICLTMDSKTFILLIKWSKTLLIKLHKKFCKKCDKILSFHNVFGHLKGQFYQQNRWQVS